MATITIPDKIIKNEELVAIPKREYEVFLRVKPNINFIIQSKRKKKLDADLQEALEDVRAGRVIGPFDTAEEGLQALKNAK